MTTLAEVFADHFYKYSATENYNLAFRRRKLAAENIPIDISGGEADNINSEFQVQELLWALDKGNGKSVGIDAIGYPMLRHLPYAIKCILLDIINRIWRAETVPDQWKTGLVIPLPKPGKNHKDVNSYRPISLLSCVGKLMERMVNRRLITRLEADKRLDQR